jgi:dTDP-4-dehydrorhamnose reductase
MIIGNGLIAQSFSGFDEQNKTTVFASGVSDSQTRDNLKFQREINLLITLSTSRPDCKLIYFSTTSIVSAQSPYCTHKHAVEDFIKRNFAFYCIYRLPQVLGYGGNKLNLINFLKSSISNNNKILIFPNSFRSIIDVEDLVSICKLTFNLQDKSVLNIAGIEFLKIIDIVNIVSMKLSIDPIVSFHEKSQTCLMENSKEIDDSIKKLGINKNKYIERVINKYL